MSIRFQRIGAWIVDWLLCCSPAVLYALVMLMFAQWNPACIPSMILPYVLLILWIPVSFVLRDVLCGGQSIGRRLFKLHVLNRFTLRPAKTSEKIVRNLFFFLEFIDGILLLATNKTIGDRVCDTVVVKE